MGDAGSTALGLLLFYLMASNTQPPTQVIAPVTALWLLALPLIDAVTLLLVRPLTGRSPFAADRLHYHHMLLATGLSNTQTLMAIILTQTSLTGLAFFMHFAGVSDQYQLNAFLLLFSCYLIVNFIRAMRLRQSNVK